MTEGFSIAIESLEPYLPARLLLQLKEQPPAPAHIAEACKQLERQLATLTPFVPAPILDMTLAQPDRPRLSGHYLNGTLLCARISGFNRLSSQLALDGRRGSEALGAIVSRLLTALLNEIEPRGGGLVTFGGDTLTCFFDSARIGPQHGSLGCAAALAMQRRMAEFEHVSANNASFQLQLRIALHSGGVLATEVGDQQHTELMVCGRVVNRAVVAQESAAPGEIILAGDMLPALPEVRMQHKHADLHLLHGLVSEPPPPPAPPSWKPGRPTIAALAGLLQRIEALRPYLPDGLRERTSALQPVGGEFRPVTVLFDDFSAVSKLLAFLELPALLEEDPSILGRVLASYYAHTQQAIHQYGGTISAVDTAPFGNRLMALFGAPIAHEDDPVRAARAALELRATLDQTNQAIAALLQAWAEEHQEQLFLIRLRNSTLRRRIGLASGTVFAGIVGPPQRHEYTVLGETVDLAARIMVAAADGEVLLTSHSYRAARHLLEAQPQPPLTLHASSESVPLYRVVGERPASERALMTTPYPTALIGRRDELAQIMSIADQALGLSEQAGQAIVVIGEAGIGKTRLLDEALRIIRCRHAVTLIRESCLSYEQTTPYAVVGRLLRQLLQLPAQEQEVDQQLNDLVPQWSRFAPLLAPLLNLPPADTELTAALTPEQRHDRLHDLIIMLFLAEARRRPLALVIDDLQWVDASSQALIERLAEELAGQTILLALVARPTSPEQPWHILPHSIMLPLGELNQSDSRTMLVALLNSAPPAALQPLIERASGMPLFLEETISYLLQSSTLQRGDNGDWVYVGPIDSTTIPARIEQLIIARLDRLEEEARVLLQIAAVIGQQFSEDDLAVMQPPAMARQRRLADLVAAGLLIPDANTPRLYHFKHGLIRDVIYESMLYARRRELHARAAAALEQSQGLDRAGQRIVLAQHYLLAEQYDQAFPHFLQAAQQAQARYANSEALALFRQAQATAPWRDSALTDIPTAALLYENMADVLALIGSYTEARDTYEWFLNTLNAGLSQNHSLRKAALQRKIGSTFEQQSNLEAAFNWLARAAETVRSAPADGAAAREQARILSDMGWIAFRRNDLEQAQRTLEQALGLLTGQEAYDEQARILNRLGGIAWARGDVTIAQAYVEQSLAASTQSGNLLGQARALNNLGNLTGSQGHACDSIHYSLQAMAISERIGNRRELAFTANNAGWAFYEHGDYQQARHYLSQSLKYAVELRDSYMQMIALGNLGWTLIALEEWSAAERTLHDSLLIATRLNLMMERLERYVALAELCLKQVDLAGATRHYEQARLLVADTESLEYGRFQRLEANIALARGQTAHAIDLLHANQALFRRLQNIPELERTTSLLHEIARQIGANTA